MFPGCRCPPRATGGSFHGGCGAVRNGRPSGRDLLSESGTQQLRIFNAPNMAALADFVSNNRHKQRRVRSPKRGVMRRLQLNPGKLRYPGACRLFAKGLRGPRILGKRSRTCTTTACAQKGGYPAYAVQYTESGCYAADTAVFVLCGVRRLTVVMPLRTR